MFWDYWQWVGASVGISTAILFSTIIVLIAFLLCYDTVFYGIVEKLFGIERILIDPHHHIQVKNKDVEVPLKRLVRGSQIVLKILNFFWICNDNQPDNISEPSPNGYGNKNDSSRDHNRGKQTASKYRVKNSPMRHLDRRAGILQMYGKSLPLYKKRNEAFILLLTTVIIASALIAAFNTLFLISTTVYRGGKCPNYGPMDCFCGSNHTYFPCDTAQDARCPFDENGATCFSWYTRYITTTDVTTQIGVTTGLFIAFGNVAQFLMRVYLAALNKKTNVAIGMYRMMSKTVTLNRKTARTSCGCCVLCCHCSVFNFSLFKHRFAVVIVTILYIAVPALIGPGISLLYYYQLNVTSLTFIFLITFGVLCVMAMIWLAVQDDESSLNVKFKWKDVQTVLEGTGIKEYLPELKELIPNDVQELQAFIQSNMEPLVKPIGNYTQELAKSLRIDPEKLPKFMRNNGQRIAEFAVKNPHIFMEFIRNNPKNFVKFIEKNRQQTAESTESDIQQRVHYQRNFMEFVKENPEVLAKFIIENGQQLVTLLRNNTQQDAKSVVRNEQRLINHV